jgi:predicted lipid carrier protein YhbT
MADQTNEFFEALRQRAHEPLLELAEGTIRFDIADNDRVVHWFVSVDNGDVTVSRSRKRADCTIRGPKAIFEGVATGEINAMTAALRGAIVIEGDAELLTLFQRVLPGPPSSKKAL